jgi:tryptophanyl-tRNA synthetase
MASVESTQHPSQVVNPLVATSTNGFDYDRLVNQFGLKRIDSSLKDRLEKITGMENHHLIKRNLVYAHLDLDLIMNDIEKGKEVYIYTGRGPSSKSLHIGHLLPFMFTAWLQKVLNCMVVIEISDEEKFYFKDGTLEQYMDCTDSNILDIISCGFNPEKTFIFSSFRYEHFMRPLIAKINKKCNVETMSKIFGFNKLNNVGQVSWPVMQMAPSLSGAFPHLFGDRKVRCLVPCAVDQAPYFRGIRDIANSLGFEKPALICCQFLPGLGGINTKSSTTGGIEPIFISDPPNVIGTKLRKYAFSGGRDTAELQKKLGADLTVDVCYHYLRFFMNNEDELLRITNDYSSGQMLTGELKKICANLLSEMIGKLQEYRNKIDSEIVSKVTSIIIRPDIQDFWNEYHRKYLALNIISSNDNADQ